MVGSISKEVCTGCKMCGDICPTNAISFQTDFDGCWYPNVDDEKCVKCGLCEKKMSGSSYNAFSERKRPSCLCCVDKG